METRTALVAGASGLVGGLLLDGLLESPLTGGALAGPPSAAEAAPEAHPAHSGLCQAGGEALPAADDAFCCLGTTIKKAGSQEAFRAVDHDAVLAFAKAARKAGARRFLLVSALGADKDSRIFYNRVKGEAEEDLKSVGFESLILLRPSLLLGDRAESRPGERAAIVATKLLGPLLRPFASRPIEASTVARAMLNLAKTAAGGTRVALSGELQDLGK